MSPVCLYNLSLSICKKLIETVPSTPIKITKPASSAGMAPKNELTTTQIPSYLNGTNWLNQVEAVLLSIDKHMTFT